ncbi:DinB family protein [Gilvibacter sediminis]|uniref:DinB family protein n=1 Tax=Gilvibacter sediminis TaxID=379071 RepID=UPI0023509DD4|nr:DinB family protein [Gilvibacter sediminis]MDC7997996.1 DinB family protein [Gilvibacter sediminis]
MKKVIFCSLFLLMSCVPLIAQEQDKAFVRDYVERLDNSRKYLLLVAEQMPEAQYNFKATPESLSFAENLMHIGFAMDWHSQSLLGGREARTWATDTVFKVADKSKIEMIGLIDKTFEQALTLLREFDVSQLEDRLDYFGLDRTKRHIFMLLADHITHHRGQMLVSLRLNGIVPPRYVLFQ